MCGVHTELKSHVSVKNWLSEELHLEDAFTLATVFGAGTSVQQLVRALDIKNDTSISAIADELENIVSRHRAHQETIGATSPFQLPAPFVLRKVAAELREFASQLNPLHGSGAPETRVRCCTLTFYANVRMLTTHVTHRSQDVDPVVLCTRLMGEFCSVAGRGEGWRSTFDKRNLRSAVVVPWEEEGELGRTQHVLNQYAVPTFIAGIGPDMKLQFIVKNGTLHGRCTLCLTDIGTNVHTSKPGQPHIPMQRWCIKDLSKVGGLRQHAVTIKHQHQLLTYLRGRRDAIRHTSSFTIRSTESSQGTPVDSIEDGQVALQDTYKRLVKEIKWREKLLTSSWQQEDDVFYFQERDVTPSTHNNLSDFTPKRSSQQ
jgi:hypothetical protein